MNKRDNIHYVNNAEFSKSVVEYVSGVKVAKEAKQDLPRVPDNIARSFLRIAEGLSHRSNFIRYTYREEMVMDAVENCLRAIENYDIEAATRSGNPNAFAYFTQISWYAFLRRIEKENRQRDIKLRYIAESGYEEFIDTSGGGETVINSFVDQLKDRIDKVKTTDRHVHEYKKKVKKKRSVAADSCLEVFFE